MPPVPVNAPPVSGATGSIHERPSLKSEMRKARGRQVPLCFILGVIEPQMFSLMNLPLRNK